MHYRANHLLAAAASAVAAGGIGVLFYAHLAAPKDGRAADDVHQSPSVTERLKELKSPKTERRLAACHDWAYDRMQTVDGLLRVAGAPKARYDVANDPRFLAVMLLGKFNCREAIPTLVANLDWKYPRVVVSERSPLDDYPCARALVEIGPESSQYLIRAVAREEQGGVESKRVELTAETLLQLYSSSHVLRSDPIQQALAAIAAFAASEGDDVKPRLARLASTLKHRSSKGPD